MTNQRYAFTSRWTIPAPRQVVWQKMTATPFAWDKWWPQLTNLRDVRTKSGLRGSSFACTWRAPFGYRLDCRIVISDVTPAQAVTLEVSGDLFGSVDCQLHDDNGRTTIDVTWHVETTRPWMNRLAPVLRPLFVQGHHAVMRSGQRGLRRQVTKKPARGRAFLAVRKLFTAFSANDQ